MFGSPNTSQGFWQEAIGSSTLLANLPRENLREARLRNVRA